MRLHTPCLSVLDAFLHSRIGSRRILAQPPVLQRAPQDGEISMLQPYAAKTFDTLTPFDCTWGPDACDSPMFWHQWARRDLERGDLSALLELTNHGRWGDPNLAACRT